jgi:AcrR family transcriptional regulator
MAVETKRKRTAKSAEDRREELMDAAVSVLRAKGTSNATVSDITETAGVAKGTFYLYFGSKEHLMAALRRRLVDDAIAHGIGFLARAGEEDWWGLVDASSASFIDYHIEHRDELALLAEEGLTAETRELLAECDRTLTGIFTAGIQAGVEAGAFHVEDPEATAMLLYHALEGALREMVVFGREFDRERLLHAMSQTARRCLA